MTTHRHILTLECADQPGIVHAVSSGFLDIDGNIVESAQFTDPDTGVFCMRTVVATDSATTACDVDRAVSDRLVNATGQRLPTVGNGTARRNQLKRSVPPEDGRPLDATRLTVRPESRRPRVLVMVSKFDHCLIDLLYRWRAGLLAVEIPLIVSNHRTCEPTAEQYGVPYIHLPVSTSTKSDQEASLVRLMSEYEIDLVVLARYMQILSAGLCAELAERAINIHHSFLPGFKGAKPYHQAHARGVKLVGATAHFVTEDLDEGPIIEQNVARVDHSRTAEDLEAFGRDIERLVLAHAVRLWAEDRVFLIGNKTVVLT